MALRARLQTDARPSHFSSKKSPLSGGALRAQCIKERHVVTMRHLAPVWNTSQEVLSKICLMSHLNTQYFAHIRLIWSELRGLPQILCFSFTTQRLGLGVGGESPLNSLYLGFEPRKTRSPNAKAFGTACTTIILNTFLKTCVSPHVLLKHVAFCSRFALGFFA